MALTVVDAGIVIAMLDPVDHHHEASVARVRALRHEDATELVLPASAYAEALVHPARAGARQMEQASSFCRRFLRIQPLTELIAERAAALRGRHRSLRLPDAFVIATAEQLGAHNLLTTDRHFRRVTPLAEVPRLT
jgi:predicted nucleic acid-binding protein